MKIYTAKNRSAFCLLAALGLILTACFQPVDLGETFVEKATAHLRVTNESADKAYVLEGLELRNTEGEVEQSWEGLDLETGDDPWEIHTETSGSCTLWYRVKDTEISSTAIGVYQADPPVEIALNRSHEFSFKGEAIEVTQQDADGDGLPDAWEEEHGFNPEDKTDGGLVYVSPLGQNEAPGNGTRDHPYLTLAKAVDKAGRGLLVNGNDDSARTVVVLGTLTWANGGNDQLNPEYKGRDDSVFYLGKARNPVTIRGEDENNPGILTAENAGNKRVLYLGPGARVTLRDMVITGGTGSGGGIYASEADLTLGPGAIIKENNKNNAVTGFEGGGIYMERGVLVMEPGSSVNDNKAYGGGGIQLVASGFTMKGGAIITRNHAGFGTGGMGAYGSTIEMFAGAEISWNTAGDATIGDAGGGASVGLYSTMTMHGGSISHNKIQSGFGGGLYVTGQSVVLMEDGEILDNECTFRTGDGNSGRGGGLMVVNGASFTMEAGTIAGNTAGRIGGGLYLNESTTTFIMRGGTIYGKNPSNENDENNNEAETNGHAICDARAGKYYNDTVIKFPQE
jgi:hypothetical protein